MPNSANQISADRPIQNPDGDILGYASIAKHLAERILTAADPEGFIVAVNGEWGSGKTSLLNMITFFLKETDDQPILITFNPWWFSGEEELARGFFEALKSGLGSQPDVGETVRILLSGLGKIVSRIPDERASKIGELLSWSSSKRELTVPELKEKISNQLRSIQKKIVVTVDDLDRLNVDEIRQVFRVVKAVADFPNVIYLMAFDADIVAKALSDPNGVDGRSFLEKIVQVPIPLPAIDRTALQKMLFAKLDELDPSPDPERFDAVHWGNVFFDGIDPLLKTPRHVIRLINALRFTYPAVREEVNFVDFVAIETLRIFCPATYQFVRDNPDTFLGRRRPAFGGTQKKATLGEILNPVTKDLSEEIREAITTMLHRLFPRTEASYGGDFDSAWRRAGRICSADCFPIYFRLSLPIGDLSASELSSILASLEISSKEFGDRLVQLADAHRPDGSTRARVFLDRLQDFTEEALPLSHVPNLVAALFDVGDRLLREEDTDKEFFAIGNDVRIGRIIYQLLRRFDEAGRFRILFDALRNGRSIVFSVYEVSVFGQEHGKNGANRSKPEAEQLLTAPHLAELESLVVEKVRAAARDGSLIHVPNLGRLLLQWSELGGTPEVCEWFQAAIADDRGLVAIIEGFLMTSRTQSMADRVGRLHYNLDSEWLKPYIDPDALIDRCREILKGDSTLSGKQKLALAEFIRTYDMRKAGKNPNDPFEMIRSRE
jgi:predicted KAP-like P-loop ATPase